MKKLNVNAIRIDGGTQSRVEIHEDLVANYAEAIEEGETFPAVVVFHDGADYWLADGFHRWHAHRKIGRASIDADVRGGSRRDAVLYSFSANNRHGKPPNPADKRKIVTAILQDAEWGKWSDSHIAKECGFSRPFVASLRASLVNVASEKPVERTYTTKHGTQATMQTAGIGKAQPKPAKRTLDNRPADVAPLTDADDLREAQDTISELAAENERLSDRLAVEAMDASEEEKTRASETITELRERVRQLEIELDAVKASRDAYMRETAELKKQCAYQRRELDKARRVAA